MIAHDVFWSNFIFYGKVVGAVVAIGGFAFKVIQYLVRGVNKISEVNTTVKALATNHIPHMAQAIDAHGTALNGLKQDMKDMDVKITGIETNSENTRKSMNMMQESFMRHLESTSKEVTKRKKR